MMDSITLLPYYLPLAAYAMLVAVLCDLRVAQVAIVAFALVLLFMLPERRRHRHHRCSVRWSGVLVVDRARAAALFCGPARPSRWRQFCDNHCGHERALRAVQTTMLLETLMVVILNGRLSAAIALIGYFVLSNLFGITTPLQLTELSRPRTRSCAGCCSRRGHLPPRSGQQPGRTMPLPSAPTPCSLTWKHFHDDMAKRRCAPISLTKISGRLVAARSSTRSPPH